MSSRKTKKRVDPATGEQVPRSLQAIALIGLMLILGSIGGVASVISLRENDLEPLLTVSDRPVTMIIVGALIALLGGSKEQLSRFTSSTTGSIARRIEPEPEPEPTTPAVGFTAPEPAGARARRLI